MGMIDRMTLILDAFDGPASRLTAEELTRRTQLPRSTVHRILKDLLRLDWVDYASSGFGMGVRALGVDAGRGHSEIRFAAAPLLHELHMQTGMVVHLAVMDAGESVYLDKVGGRLASSLPSRVGGRVPAFSTACGKSMLAWLDPELVDVLYAEQFGRCTDRTITDVPMLHRELNVIRRRRGLAFEYGESFRGVGCVGAAIRDNGEPVAGISVCGDAHAAQFERVAPLVVATARRVSQAMRLSAEH